jgi:hypothetical protein
MNSPWRRSDLDLEHLTSYEAFAARAEAYVGDFHTLFGRLAGDPAKIDLLEYRQRQSSVLKAMQAVVDPLVEADPKLGKVDARTYISDRYLKKLEDEGFVQKLTGR